MGGKTSSFISRNSIYVQTDKSVYYSGEQVTGTIYLNIVGQPFDSKGVFLELEGYEQVWWQEKTRKHIQRENGPDEWIDEYHDHREKRHVLHYKIPVYQFRGMLNPGQYTFPFSFTLPQNLAGTFHEHSEGRFDTRYEASTYYRLEVECDAAGFNWDIEHEIPITIHEALWTNIEPKTVQCERNVMFCCCCDQGTVELTAHFERNAYAPGDLARLTVEVANKSKSDVDTIHGKLKRRLSVRAHGRTHTEVETLQDVSIPGVPAGDTLLGGNARSIEVPLTSHRYGLPEPSSNGELIKCEYWLECECAISWAPDIAVDLPVVIYAPANMNYQYIEQPPPGWNNPQVYQSVNLEFAPQYARNPVY